MKIKFYDPEKRNKRFREKGYEYALNCSLDNERPWTITTFDKKPKKEIVQLVKDVTMRSMEFYHRSIIWPSFELVEVDDD